MYEHWFRRYPQELVPVRSKSDLQRLAEMKPVNVDGRVGYPTGILLLMEGLELLSNHAELAYWHSCGVRMASLSWNGVNQFASGVFGDAKGLRPAGFELLKEFTRMGLILDLAHLNDAGIADVLVNYEGPLCSSHTNARSVAGHQRNLTDSQINAIAARGGVIGLNLLAPFVVQNWRRGDPQPEVADATAHTAHVANLVGPEHVGIGSDLDGGLTPENTPRGIDRVDHLPLLAEDLARRGWPTDCVAGFLGANWWRFFERNLPN
jgi:membrane dipeptidase